MAWSMIVTCSEKQLSRFLRQSSGAYTSMTPPKEIGVTPKKTRAKKAAVATAVTSSLKKRGRPRKLKIVTATDIPTAPKKRGRPRKNPQPQAAA